MDFVEWCMEDGIEILTVYAFSTENWSREQHEVTTLMLIISKYADSFKQEAKTRNVRVKVLATGIFFGFSSWIFTALHRFRPPPSEYSRKGPRIGRSYQRLQRLPSQYLLELWR